MKKRLCILVTFIFLLSLSGCYTYVNDNYVVPTINPDVFKKPQNTQGEKGIKLEMAVLDETQVHDINEEIEVGNMKYKINNVKIQKNLEKFTKDDFTYYTDDEKTDQNGNLTGSFSYIIVNITIKNLLDEDKEVYMNNYFILTTDIDNKFTMPLHSGVPKAFFKPQNKNEGKSYFKYVFSPGENTSFDLIYITEDDALSKNMLFVISPNKFIGFEQDKETNAAARFFRLKNEVS